MDRFTLNEICLLDLGAYLGLWDPKADPQAFEGLSRALDGLPMAEAFGCDREADQWAAGYAFGRLLRWIAE